MLCDEPEKVEFSLSSLLEVPKTILKPNFELLSPTQCTVLDLLMRWQNDLPESILRD